MRSSRGTYGYRAEHGFGSMTLRCASITQERSYHPKNEADAARKFQLPGLLSPGFTMS